MKDFLTALTLLTVFPIQLPPLKEGETWSGGRALAYYPLVGLIIGGLLVVARFTLQLLFPSLVTAALLVALWAAITGALHLDGFTDACDALFVPTNRERRLEILHDVHLGAFGAVGLGLLLITKTASVANTISFWPILLAPILGRWAIVYTATYPLARKEGMGAMFRAGLTRREVIIATVLAALACIACGLFGVIAFALAFLAATGVARLAVAKIGGLTGDIYGTVCETVELAVLLAGTVTLAGVITLPV
ncbi:MAG: adenosylcobinamide-GDP ribazoletransferase [Chloroflexi bacterium]|nr:adenosylcobinamide-GDP ribazoletransferase [Chloroflexota bacterium]